jgi:uncharacterized membrane protein YdfJ with MMPL/SSD domain
MTLNYIYPAILIVLLGGLVVRPVIVSVRNWVEVFYYLTVFIAVALGAVVGVDYALEMISR